MKVYILIEYDIESYPEILGVFDSLNKAQSYRDGKPEDWITNQHTNGWWDRTIVTTKYGISISTHLSIVEWEVQ